MEEWTTAGRRERLPGTGISAVRATGGRGRRHVWPAWATSVSLLPSSCWGMTDSQDPPPVHRYHYRDRGCESVDPCSPWKVSQLSVHGSETEGAILRALPGVCPAVCSSRVCPFQQGCPALGALDMLWGIVPCCGAVLCLVEW